MLCPCGSKQTYPLCCAKYIENFAKNKSMLPELPEQLMRSRFTAYALNDALYIFATYAKQSQSQHSLQDISEWSSQCKWLELTVHDAPIMEIDEQEFQYVEFSAFYIHNDTVNVMREKSRFIKERNNDNQLAWRYLDGDILQNDVIKQIKRNEICPCNNYFNKQSKKAKKYKHCCGS